MPSRLLVLIPDRLSSIITKGELQPRYYNPGDLFDEVHVLMTNDDQPDAAPMATTVGRGKLFFHNYPDDLNLVSRSPGFLRAHRLRRWAAGGVELVRSIAPQLIRCHGADWNGYLASRVRRALSIPYVVSLHINPDVNPPRRIAGPDLSPEQLRHNGFYDYIERQCLLNADLVMPVYQPIVPYLRRLGVERFEVCYNVLDGQHLRAKSSYSLTGPPRIVSVGRLFADKYPDHLIEAVAQQPGVQLDIVGDGPARGEMEALVQRLGVGERIRFRPSVLNSQLCAELPDYDLFAVHTEHFEINKSVLEALLSGLPIIINRRQGEPVPELEGDFVRMVDNTTQGYRDAIAELLADDDARAALGRRAFAHATERWAPEKTEARYADIYSRFRLAS